MRRLFFKRMSCRQGLVAALAAAGLLLLYILHLWSATFEMRARYAGGLTGSLRVLAQELEWVQAGQPLPQDIARQAREIGQWCSMGSHVWSGQSGFPIGQGTVGKVMHVIYSELGKKESLDGRDLVYLKAVAEECRRLYDAFYQSREGGAAVQRRRWMTAGYYREQFEAFKERFDRNYGRGAFYDPVADTVP